MLPVVPLNRYFCPICRIGLKLKLIFLQSVNNFKTSRIPVVNDENREVFGKKNENNSSSCRSQIPIDISKKNQLIVTEKVKPKTKEIAQIKEELGYSSNLIPDNVENIDANDGHNVFLTPDYVNDIYSYLRYLEVCLQLWI